MCCNKAISYTVMWQSSCRSRMISCRHAFTLIMVQHGTHATLAFGSKLHYTYSPRVAAAATAAGPRDLALPSLRLCHLLLQPRIIKPHAGTSTVRNSMCRGCKISASSDMHLAGKDLIFNAAAMILINSANNKAGFNLCLVLKPWTWFGHTTCEANTNAY